MLSDTSRKVAVEMTIKLKKALMAKTITKFQYEVYNLLLNIPEGKVTTYKEIAKTIKCNSAQAIGQALRKNPFAPEVPCHRVVKSDLTLGGFSGSIKNNTVEKKMKLLKAEGVELKVTNEDQCSQATVDKKSLWRCSDTSEL